MSTANVACAWCSSPATRTATLSRAWGRVRMPACEKCAAWATRKGGYMPCIIGERFDSMAPAEQAQIIRRTYWADLITDAEWPVVLRHDGVKAYVRSKFKKKAVGWLMALSRIVRLSDTFGLQVLREADALYREQVQEPPPIPWAALADMIETGWEGDQIVAWLRPLGKLASFDAAEHTALIDALIADDRYERWSAPKDDD